MIRGKTLIGLSAAAFLAPAVLGLASAAMIFRSGPSILDQWVGWIVASMIVGVPIALIHAFGIALPLYAKLSARRPLRWWSAALGGLFVGTAPAGLIALAVMVVQGPSWGVPLESFLLVGWYLGWLGLAGVAGGLVFWLFARSDAA
ncbi:MAG TPA: hypothetical protein VK980_11430 [Sphingomonas sp.]|nr:hypothetical protein [Sphingomonas sp.]